jgi:hypothetical protein
MENTDNEKSPDQTRPDPTRPGKPNTNAMVDFHLKAYWLMMSSGIVTTSPTALCHAAWHAKHCMLTRSVVQLATAGASLEPHPLLTCLRLRNSRTDRFILPAVHAQHPAQSILDNLKRLPCFEDGLRVGLAVLLGRNQARFGLPDHCILLSRARVFLARCKAVA